MARLERTLLGLAAAGLGAWLLSRRRTAEFAFHNKVVFISGGSRGLGLAVSALAIGLAMLAYPGFLAYRFYRLPPINDITTDMADPPRFEAVSRLRPRGANPLAYPGPEVAAQQRRAYADIEPLIVSVRNSP